MLSRCDLGLASLELRKGQRLSVVKFPVHSPQSDPDSSKHMVSTERWDAMFGWENVTRIDVYLLKQQPHDVNCWPFCCC